MKNKLKRPPKISMDFQIDVDFRQLARNIVGQLQNHGRLEYFVALLDRLAEDWEVTNNLIQHFKALEQEMIEECLPSEYDLTPKKIEVIF